MREACERGMPHLSAAHGRNGSSCQAIESLNTNCPSALMARRVKRSYSSTALSMACSGLDAVAHVQRCVPTPASGLKASRQKACRRRRARPPVTIFKVLM